MAKTLKIGEEYYGEVVSEKYNPLIKRLEIIVKFSHVGKGTPSRGVVRKAIAELYNVDVERVFVRKIESEYGWGVTSVEAHIYDTSERAKLFEPEHIIKRNEQALELLELEQGG